MWEKKYISLVCMICFIVFYFSLPTITNACIALHMDDTDACLFWGRLRFPVLISGDI